MLRHSFRHFAIFAFVLMAFGARPPVALGQLATQHIKGSSGLKAGSEPPPGGYIPMIYYRYTTDEVKGQDGRTLPGNAELTTAFYGVGYTQVTSKKIFGGLYGFTVLFPLGANNRIQGTEIDQNPGAGLTDSMFTPISLGWHHARADILTAFNIYAPTGRYTPGANNNTGLGMWGFEPEVGTTVYFDAAKRYHAATLVSFDMQTDKEDSDTHVGDQINFEGGAGGDFLKGGLTTGLVYYASYKVTDDTIEGIPGMLIRGKNKVFAIGPEATLAIAVHKKVYGFVTVRYFWELWARTTTQGSALYIQGTLLTKPITVP